jgi:hypothetical protein
MQQVHKVVFFARMGNGGLCEKRPFLHEFYNNFSLICKLVGPLFNKCYFIFRIGNNLPLVFYLERLWANSDWERLSALKASLCAVIPRLVPTRSPRCGMIVQIKLESCKNPR